MPQYSYDPNMSGAEEILALRDDNVQRFKDDIADGFKSAASGFVRGLGNAMAIPARALSYGAAQTGAISPSKFLINEDAISGAVNWVPNKLGVAKYEVRYPAAATAGEVASGMVPAGAVAAEASLLRNALPAAMRVMRVKQVPVKLGTVSPRAKIRNQPYYRTADEAEAVEQARLRGMRFEDGQVPMKNTPYAGEPYDIPF